MGIPVLRGRDLDERDQFGRPSVVMINQAFADRYFPNEDPIGQHLHVCWGIPNPVEIAGVVRDVRQLELQTPAKPTIFLPNAQAPMYFANLVVRTSEDPRRITPSIRNAVHRVNPDQAVADIRTMEDVFSDSVARPRFQFQLLTAFAVLALALATIGVYGVVAYSVSQRVQEIGIRLALGAGRGDIVGLVLREGVLLAGIGIGCGLAISLALTRLLKSLLFEVEPTDPLTLAAVSLLLLAVTVAAAFVPARRAMRVDPATALRYE